MNKCNCGFWNVIDAKYCRNCGQKLYLSASIKTTPTIEAQKFQTKTASTQVQTPQPTTPTNSTSSSSSNNDDSWDWLWGLGVLIFLAFLLSEC